jgi:tetratricopeptide (TPR) repeat protein
MAHPTTQELQAKLRAARETDRPGQRPTLEKVKRLRELLATCPTFTPGMVELARTLQLTEEPGVDAEDAFIEIQQLLEQAVEGSDRSAPAVIELAYFLDSIRNAPEKARPLYEEGASRALANLEDAWAGLLTQLTLEEKLEEALALAQKAEQLFPDSVRLMGSVLRLQQLVAARAGQRPPSES